MSLEGATQTIMFIEFCVAPSGLSDPFPQNPGLAPGVTFFRPSGPENQNYAALAGTAAFPGNASEKLGVSSASGQVPSLEERSTFRTSESFRCTEVEFISNTHRLKQTSSYS
jgi:hypothetical protein